MYEPTPDSLRTVPSNILWLPVVALTLVAASCYSSAGFIEGGVSDDAVADAHTPALDVGSPDDRPRPVPPGSPDAMAADAGLTPAPPSTQASVPITDAEAGADSVILDGSIPARDAGFSDIGTTDGGGPVDASQAVTGSMDAGSMDAGSMDAGSMDAGAPGDGSGAVDAATGETAVNTVAGFTLVFFDEFNGTSLDRTKWCTRYVYPGGPALQVPDGACTGPNGSAGTLDHLNDEQERYVDYNSKNETMHVEAGGTLSLRATKTRTDNTASYEAAMIRSKFEFKPTDSTSFYILAKLRLPNVIGTWPALWLNGGYGTNGTTQWPPEIDIFEGALNGVEDTASMIRMGSQVRGAQTDSQKQEITSSQSFNATWDDYYSATSLRDVWVTISAIWTSKSICYFVNGIQTMCENYRWSDNAGTPANPASVLLNIGIGGSWAGRHGIDDTKFPTSLDADYVHVYTFNGATIPSTLPN